MIYTRKDVYKHNKHDKHEPPKPRRVSFILMERGACSNRLLTRFTLTSNVLMAPSPPRTLQFRLCCVQAGKQWAPALSYPGLPIGPTSPFLVSFDRV